MAGLQVAPGVHRFQSRFVNWYLIEDGPRLTAVDAGLPPAWNDLQSALRQMGRALSDLEAVVLTHGHVDHLGFAEQARTQAGATVYVHEDDAGMLRHPLRAARSERTPLAYLGQPSTRRALAAMVATGSFQAKRVREHVGLADGALLAAVPGRPRVVHLPGHTLGSCALHLPDRGVLFSGDALVTRDPYTGRVGPQVAARAATRDSAQALRSLERIAALEADVLLPGHGEPWRGGTAEAVRQAREAGVP